MKIIVNPHKLEIIKNPVNEKEINITKCEFEFSEEITNDYVKEAYFTYNGVSYKQIIVNNECDIPYEVLEEKGQVELGVVAYLLENDEYVKRYNPSPAYFESWIGSLKGKAENSEPITPSEMEQYEQALQNGLTSIDNKLSDVDDKMLVVDGKLEDINTAITQTNNLDLDVSKEGKIATVTLNKKDASTKVVTLSDGTSLMFRWEGTSLGIKTDEDADYTYVDLQGVQGETGPMGAPFTIKKTYSSVAEMNADFNNMEVGDYVMITSTVEVEDNAKLYCKGTEQWIFITDFSGATGIQGPTGLTPNIQIGTVVSGETPSVTRTGTNENPILNFTLVKGDTGETGATGATGNGIASISKTGTSGTSVDIYTITYTNGTTTTFEVTNGEVTQAQLDEVQAQVDYYKTTLNALPKVTGTGTELTLNNTANAPLELELNPSELEQATTTGKNLFDKETMIHNGYISPQGIINTTDTGTRTIVCPCKPNQTYTVSKILSKKFRCAYINEEYSSSATTYGFVDDSTATTYTVTTGNDAKYLLAYVWDYSTAETVTYNDVINSVQIEEGSTATEYEPYTNGPSPNPDYPQDIHVITGDNEIKVSNKNILDFDYYMQNIYPSNRRTKLEDGGWEIKHTDNAQPLYEGLLIAPVSLSFLVKSSEARTNIYEHTFMFKIYFEDGTNENTGFGETTTYARKTYHYNKNIVKISTNYTVTSPYTIIKDVQLEYNTQETDYVEHKEATYPLTLGNLEYCKTGNYKDKFVKTNGIKLYTSEFRQGSETNLTTTTRLFSNNPTYLKPSEYIFTSNIYSNFNYYIVIREGNTSSSTRILETDWLSNDYGFTLNQDGYLWIGIKKQDGTSLTVSDIDNGTFDLEEISNEATSKGKWYLKKNIKKLVCNGNEGWRLASGNAPIRLDIADSGKLSTLNSQLPNIYSTHLPRTKYESSWATFDNLITGNTTDKILYIRCMKVNNDLNSFKTLLETEYDNGTPLVVYYPLSVPTYTLLNNTLQEQLDNINMALGYQEQTNISQENDDLPFNINASAVKDMSNIFNLIEG